MKPYEHPEKSGFQHALDLSAFKRAAYNELYDGAILQMPVDQGLQMAITAYAQQLHPEARFDLTLSDGIVSLKDPKNLCMPILKDRLELLAQSYHDMTGFEELVVLALRNSSLWEHDHPYEAGNMVVDVVDTNNSDEIGTTLRDRHGNWTTAPVGAFSFFKRNVTHSGTRMTHNGLTFVVRPTDHYVGCHFE